MRISRREFLTLSAAAGAVTFFPWGKSLGSAFAMPAAVAPPGLDAWSTQPLDKWVDALPIPPVAKGGVLGGASIRDPLTGNTADWYRMQAVQSNTWNFHRDLPATTTWGYSYGGGLVDYDPVGAHIRGYLGPSILAAKNKPVVLDMTNNLPHDPLYKDAYDYTIGNGLAGTAMYPNISRIDVHLHGGFTAPQCDGHPDAWFGPNGEHGLAYRSLPGVPKNAYRYSYSNLQRAGLLWYHDHAMYQTRLNPFAGLAAGYVIADENDTVLPVAGSLNVPKFPYDIPLIIQDRIFYQDGSMFYPTASGLPDPYPHPVWQPEYFGDTPVVNGKAYPRLEVEPRRYRLRFLNGSQARFYHLSLGGLPMWIIGTEGGLLPRPVPVNDFLMAPAERFDVIVDFSTLSMGTTVTLTNDAGAPFGGGPDPALALPEIMQFKVSLPRQGKDTTLKPSSLALPGFQRTIPNLPLTNLYKLGIPVRENVLKETADPDDNPTHVRINGLWFMDPVEETPKVGGTEVWSFVNLTGDAHPMHTHLIMFHVLGRVPFNVAAYEADWNAWIAAGRNPKTKPKALNYATGGLRLPPPEEWGLKDTVKCYPEEIALIAGKFDIPPGSQKGGMTMKNGNMMFDPKVNSYEYVYHCHILEHEENEMMRPFDVVA